MSAFVLLFFAAVAERGHPAISKVRQGGIIAALADPLSLFAERSPGERGGGALLSTKPGGPHERVLSEVRDRDPPAGDPPELAITPEDLAALPGGAPGAGGAPGDPAGDPLGNNFFAPSIPSGGGGPPFLPASFGAPPGGPPPNGPIPPVIDPPGAGAVPEPATWAMLLLGFFAVGVALRRRERGKPA
ncbi:MAG TPA: PEPxxWA-CTERM sorting domain-containing protein [Rhizomicrobium sp.]|nr:PEPxxWA-CTERM sorting domain-containing protein [Rhizomicrobium sp.]